MPLLEVSNLTVAFENDKSAPAIDNISFSVEEGETLGVVGESGSGKTLTGLAIMGLMPSFAIISGEIFLYSKLKRENLLKLSEKEKEKYRGKLISMIFQEPMTALNPVVKCGKQVDEVLKLHTNLSKTQRDHRILELFKEILLPNPVELYNKYPHQVSGGQRQRVMIAMAVACNPKILIADEPTTALDVATQQSILDLLGELKKRYNISIIFISHDLAVISKISDKVIVLCKGKKIESGITGQIMNQPEAAYTKGLIACRPRTDIRLERLPVIEDFIKMPEKNSLLIHTSKSVREKNHEKIYLNPPLLTINNLNVYFNQKYNFTGKLIKQFHSLKEINIKIWKGECVGLIGESGSGKTTVGKALMQLIDNCDGNIYFKKIKVSNIKGSALTEYRKAIQLIFQDPLSSLNPYYTIGYSITEPMVAHKLFNNYNERKKRTLEIMDMVGLSKQWYYRYPHQLSGGQRQRVAIARALALKPEILICDESVSSLDVSIQAQMLNLLNDLKQDLNLTYIFISHDIAVVKHMCDRIYVLKDGMLVEEGEADSLFENPKNEYTKTLFKAALF